MAGTVLVGLSGGVDSALTVLLLKEQGYTVIGASMSIYNSDIPSSVDAGKACYGHDEKADIKNIHLLGQQLGIDTYVFDLSQAFKAHVLSAFKDAYTKGLTPNPCVQCNEVMKFGLLVDKARAQGLAFDAFATGHYARIEQKDGRYMLRRGADEKKDQSYFLYRLSQEKLAHTLFPLGAFTKTKVRELARAKGLPVALSEKPDSQDFYAGDYADLLNLSPRVGTIMTREGRPLGQHHGYWHYTVGQRKGLGIAYPEPLFVVDIDADKNIVYVGTAADTLRTDACVGDVHFVAWDKAQAPTSPFRAFAKQRSAARPEPVTAQLTQAGEKLLVRYDTPQKSITAGQSLVLYDTDGFVLCGGLIEKQ